MVWVANGVIECDGTNHYAILAGKIEAYGWKPVDALIVRTDPNLLGLIIGENRVFLTTGKCLIIYKQAQAGG